MSTSARAVINPIHWNDALSINIPSLDHEHHTIIDTLNLYIAHIDDPQQYTVMDRLLRDLFALMTHHFAHEEQLMQDCDCPHLKSHKDEHDKFILKMREIDQELDAGTAKADALAVLIMGWFTTHTLRHDQMLGQYLVQHLTPERTPLEFEQPRSS